MPAGEVEVMARALRPDIGYTKVRIDGRERIVRDLYISHSRSLKKCGLSAVGFSRKGQSDHVWFLSSLSGFILF